MQVNIGDFIGSGLDRAKEQKPGMTSAYSARVTQERQNAASRRSRRAYGFTLVEVMIVVAIVGVLAAIGVVGFRKYMRAAAAAEVKAVMQAIRVSEEAIRAETFQYRGCGAGLTDWYPATPDDKKRHWDTGQVGQAKHDCWRELNVVTDGPVRFGYAVQAGIAPQPNPVPVINYCTNWAAAHAQVDGPWFVVQAAGDQNADGVMSLFASSSVAGNICVEPTHGDDE